jgi:hypothetical protein
MSVCRGRSSSLEIDEFEDEEEEEAKKLLSCPLLAILPF